MADQKNTLAVQIEGLKAQRKGLIDKLNAHVDPETGKANASAHFAASVAEQVKSINQTIEALESLDEEGNAKK